MPRDLPRFVVGVFAVALVAVAFTLTAATSDDSAPFGGSPRTRARTIGWITIPRIGVAEPVISSVNFDEPNGVLWVPLAVAPCDNGVALFGVRALTGGAFEHLREMRVGDVVRVTTRQASCEYRLRRPPFRLREGSNDLRALFRPREEPVILISSCDPRCDRFLIVEAIGTVSTRRGPTPSRPPFNPFGDAMGPR